ncbi:Fic family protein [Pseudoflavitalea rhizosphaerae]|uniref:Fic family protein n=1 Tax=Pseudoflavitalea rhizosphaerae TaxID=1884793 RepID=UPI0019D058EF|nr:Fic family protein [Pseudoflavitalea rhizosphaerae]
MTSLSGTQMAILEFIRDNPGQSSLYIHEGISGNKAYATTKRAISQLIAQNWVIAKGQGKSTRYYIGSSFMLLSPVDIEKYFLKEIDERTIKSDFNLELIGQQLPSARVFTDDESKHLDSLQEQFKRNISKLTPTEYNKEFERLAIDLSWKSSQIEGNTYSLLETERLLKDKEVAIGKPKEDATMLLNHKDAISFIIDHPDYVVPLTISRIEDIHSILLKDLGVDRNIRQGRVGISGTNYRPLDNEYQIREAVRDMCELINSRASVFEKSLLSLVLLSYIQPFVDGNKRTARIVSNAILIANNYCPISFRTVDSVEYKKAMLIFYEQNNISAFKKIFIGQFEFAVKTYF